MPKVPRMCCRGAAAIRSRSVTIGGYRDSIGTSTPPKRSWTAGNAMLFCLRPGPTCGARLPDSRVKPGIPRQYPDDFAQSDRWLSQYGCDSGRHARTRELWRILPIRRGLVAVDESCDFKSQFRRCSRGFDGAPKAIAGITLRQFDSFEFSPKAIRLFCVRIKNRPAEIAGVARIGSPQSFVLTSSNLLPAFTTSTRPSSADRNR